jgi:hypothetical protein
MLSQAMRGYPELTYFPKMETSAAEGGSGDAAVVKLTQSGIDHTDPEYKNLETPSAVLPSLTTTSPGVIHKNAQAVVEAEVVRVEPYLNECTPPQWVEEAKVWFIDNLFPKEVRSKGCPISMEDAQEFDRPTQARALEQVIGDALRLTPEKMGIFLKTEVIDPASAPRIICCPDDVLRVFSRVFGKPLGDYIKDRLSSFAEYIGEGKYGFVDPSSLELIMERVIEQVREFATETDISKMDASVNSWWRKFERDIGDAFYDPEYHDLWHAWHEKLYKMEFTKRTHGERVKLGPSRRSGEFYTSLFNTIDMLFLPFCSYLKQKFGVRDRYTHDQYCEAWTAVGVGGGDDGLHADLSPEIVEEVGALMGFTVKAAKVSKGRPVSFLGVVRWAVKTYTYDPIRFVSKFSCVPTGPNIPWYEGVFRKFEAFVDLYPDVPLIGTGSTAVMRCLENRGVFQRDVKYDVALRKLNGWLHTARINSVNQLPCKASYEEMVSYYADRLDIPVSLVLLIEDSYKKAQSFSDFPRHCIKVETKEFKFPTMFQGNLYAIDKAPAQRRDKVIPKSAYHPKHAKQIKEEPKQEKEGEGWTIAKVKRRSNKAPSGNAGSSKPRGQAVKETKKATTQL